MKENKTMFWIGIMMIITTAVLLLTVKGDLGGLTFIGFLGIIFIAASKYRPLGSQKNKNKDKGTLIGIISVSILVVLTLVIYALSAFRNGQTTIPIVAIIVSVLAGAIAFKYLKNRHSEVEKGMPLVDERTNKVFLVAAAKAFVISIWYLLILAWSSDEIISFRDPSQALGAGIIGMSLILGVSYLYYNKKENIDKVRF